MGAPFLTVFAYRIVCFHTIFQNSNLFLLYNYTMFNFMEAVRKIKYTYIALEIIVFKKIT